MNTKVDKSSMNDSSKRLRDHPQAEVDEEWEPVTYGENPGKSITCERVIPKGMMDQPRIAPTMAKAVKQVSLPPGVTDIETGAAQSVLSQRWPERSCHTRSC